MCCRPEYDPHFYGYSSGPKGYPKPGKPVYEKPEAPEYNVSNPFAKLAEIFKNGFAKPEGAQGWEHARGGW